MSLSFSPALQEFIKEYESKAHAKPPTAVFDCDGTIIKGDIGEAMFYYQIEHFLLRMNPANIWLDHPKREELDNLYTQLAPLPGDRRTQDRRFISFSEMMLEWYFDQLSEGKTEKACSDIVRLWTKFSPQEVEQIALATFDEEFASPITFRKFGKHSVPKGIRYIQESVELLKQLQQIGFDIWAISGSNQWSVQAVFERLGVPEHHVIGIELQLASNTFSQKVQSPVPVLQGKVEALQQMSATQPSIVVSDSIYDIPLFEYSADMKVLVNSRMETSYTFFKEGNIVPDDSWIVIETPTLQE